MEAVPRLARELSGQLHDADVEGLLRDFTAFGDELLRHVHGDLSLAGLKYRFPNLKVYKGREGTRLSLTWLNSRVQVESYRGKRDHGHRQNVSR